MRKPFLLLSAVCAAILLPPSLSAEGVSISFANYTGTIHGSNGVPIVTPAGIPAAASYAWLGKVSAPSATAAQYADNFVPLHASPITPAAANGMVNALAFSNATNSLPAGFSAGTVIHLLIGDQPLVSASTKIAIFELGALAEVNPVDGLDQSFTLSASSPPIIGSLQAVASQPTASSSYTNGVVLKSTSSSGGGSNPSFSLADANGAPMGNGATAHFGTLTLGAQKTLSFEIKNTGDVGLSQVQATISSGNNSDFSFITRPATTIAPGAKSVFSIRFAPGATGNRTTKLALTSSQTSGETFALHLAGAGNAPPVTKVPEIAVLNGTTNLNDGAAATFGNVNRGSEKILTFTIRNTGTANLTGIKATWAGGNSADFVITGAPVSTLAPNASTHVAVRFKPSANGKRSTALRIASNDANENPFDLALSGTGIGSPEIMVLNGTTNLNDGAAASFGNVNRGSEKTLTFTIRNTGTANLTGIKATLAGGNTADFLITSAPVSTLAPNASTHVAVRFKPSANGKRATALRIASNDSNENPFDLALSGTAIGSPEISVSKGKKNLVDGKATLSFGKVKTGKRKTITLTVKNVGSKPLKRLSASIKGKQAKQFSFANKLPAKLAPGKSAKLKITFHPAKSGKRTAALRIASNDANENPFNISLSGTANQKPAPKKSALLAASGDPGIIKKHSLAGLPYMTITLDKTSNPAAFPLVEVSSDRVNWFSGPSFTKVIKEDSTHLTVRDLTPSTPGKRFIRARWIRK